ncbi:MAG: mitochondrial fission ELM1 family protein [Thiogranum sp.]|nr:mitochondrial fission ELM1 family protein [Thiogranum sp.]
MNDTAIHPRIWLVIGDKLGDNAQVEIIADALQLPYETRRVLPKPQFVLGKPKFKPALDHLDLERSDKLEAPWPDLILTIGRRPAMAALWIQEQSGGHSKIVLLGRPKRWMERFALIIVPSQYRMPDDPKVLHLDLPLMRGNTDAIARAGEAWRERFSELPRPVTALLVGGQTKPFRFDADAARVLLDSAGRAAGDGCLYITTSRRTPPAVVDTFKNHLPANARLYCWSPDNSDNPYLALLALADRFIVTGDSVSMMVEVARLGKPLAIFALPYQKGLGPRLQQLLGAWLHGGAGPERGSDRLLIGLGKLLYRLGLVRYSRDLTAVHRLLYEKRLAVPLGEPFPSTGITPESELDVVTERIHAVIAQS